MEANALIRHVKIASQVADGFSYIWRSRQDIVEHSALAKIEVLSEVKAQRSVTERLCCNLQELNLVFCPNPLRLLSQFKQRDTSFQEQRPRIDLCLLQF